MAFEILIALRNWWSKWFISIQVHIDQWALIEKIFAIPAIFIIFQAIASIFWQLWQTIDWQVEGSQTTDNQLINIWISWNLESIFSAKAMKSIKIIIMFLLFSYLIQYTS